MEIIIRKLQIEDLETIKDELQEKFDVFWTYNVLKSELENPLSTYIVAVHNNEIVGYAGIWQPTEEVHITNIVTKKEFRNQKIGTKMLEELIINAQQRKLNEITLEVNVNNKIAINLYSKYNFKQVGIRKKYYNNTEDALIMTLKL